MKIGKIIITVVVLAACVASVQAVKYFSLQSKLKRVAMKAEARIKGAPGASIRIVEFTDFQCPACAKAADVLAELLKRYEGKISLQHKHFPLAMHKNAVKASVFAECAAEQNKFWPFHDVMFKSQSSWSMMEDPSAYFQDLAIQLGLDDKAVMACVSGEAAMKRVDSDRIDGEIQGVKATPSFVVDGRLIVGAGNLKTEIDSRLGQ